MVSVDSVDSVDTVSWSLSIICVIICVDWNIKRYVSLYYLDNDHILTLTLIRFSGKQREDQRNKSRVNVTKLWWDKWGLGNRVSAQSEGLQERPSSSPSKVIIENIDVLYSVPSICWGCRWRYFIFYVELCWFQGRGSHLQYQAWSLSSAGELPVQGMRSTPSWGWFKMALISLSLSLISLSLSLISLSKHFVIFIIYTTGPMVEKQAA